MQSSLLLEVVICTYNNAALLDRVLTTLANQQVALPNYWSVLVVDNNCTDSTADVVAKHSQSQSIPGLRRIVESRQGLTYARLCGIHNTTGRWIAFVDDDCLLAEDWIEQAMQFAVNHPECGAFGGKVILDWETPPSPMLIKYARSFAASDQGNTPKLLPRQKPNIPGAGLVVQRSAMLKSGWLEQQFLNDREGQNLTSGGDSEIIFRIRNAGYELWYNPNCVLKHFIPTRRISEAYLVKLNYGFGLAAPYLAAMRWNYSWLLWLLISVLRIFKGGIATLYLLISNVLRHQNSPQESLVMWNWTKGQFDTLKKILQTNNFSLRKWFIQFQ